jgi:hypothetical protein
MVKIKSASILCNVHVFPSAPSPAPTPSTWIPPSLFTPSKKVSVHNFLSGTKS